MRSARLLVAAYAIGGSAGCVLCGCSVKKEIDLIAVASLAVNISLVILARTFFRRGETRSRYLLDALVGQAREIDKGLRALHSRIAASDLQPMTLESCHAWLQSLRDTTNELHFLREETRAWGMPEGCDTICAQAQQALRLYKRNTTGQGFPCEGFQLTPALRSPTEHALTALVKRLADYRRSLIR